MRVAALTNTRFRVLLLFAVLAGDPVVSTSTDTQDESRWNNLRFLSGPVLSRQREAFSTTSLLVRSDRILVQLADGAQVEIPVASVTSFGYLHDAFRGSLFGSGTELMPIVPGPGLLGKTNVHLIAIEFRDSAGKAAGVLLEVKKKDVYAAILRSLARTTGMSASVAAADRDRLPRDVPAAVVPRPPSGTLPGVPQWPVRWLSGHRNKVTSVAFSPDGSLLAAGSEDGTIRFWQTETGLPEGSAIETHAKPVAGLAFRADGRTLAAWGYQMEYGLLTWDVATRALVGRVPLGLKRIDEVVFSNDLRFAAVIGQESTSADTILRLVDIQNRKMVSERLVRHPNWRPRVEFYPDGARLLTSGPTPNPVIQVWNAETGELVHRLEGHDKSLCCATIAADGHFLVSDESRSLFLIDVNGAVLARRNSKGGTSYAVSPDGQVLAHADWPQAVVLLDGRTLESLGSPLVGQRGSVAELAFGPSATLLATASTGHLVVWDVRTQEAIGQCFIGPPQRFDFGAGGSSPTARFAPNGRAVAMFDTGSKMVALCPVGEDVRRPRE